jgi:hypothetical protein
MSTFIENFTSAVINIFQSIMEIILKISFHEMDFARKSARGGKLLRKWRQTCVVSATKIYVYKRKKLL